MSSALAVLRRRFTGRHDPHLDTGSRYSLDYCAHPSFVYLSRLRAR